MKNTLKRALAIVLTLITVMGASLSVSASADSVLIDEVGSFDEETGIFTVTQNVPSLSRPHCSEWYEMRNSIKSIVIENGVTEIGNWAFYNCVNLEDIYFSVTLEEIGNKAFSNAGAENADALEFDLPGSLRYIGENAFSACNIKNIVIPGRVTYVGQGAFNGSDLVSIEILSSGTLIKNLVFANCENLKTVKIPDRITIDQTAFQGCQSVETVYYTGSEESYAAMEFLSNSNTNINWADTYYNQPATPYPVSISIGSMPEKTEYEVGEELYLTGFELALEMTDGTTQILSDLSKMYIHDFHSSALGEARITVEHYGYKAYIPYTVVEDPNGKCGDDLKWVFDDESGVLTISGYGEMDNFKAYNSTPWYLSETPWYEYRNDIKEVNIEARVNSIGDYAFYECNGFTEINLPSSIQTISSKAFEGSGIDTIYYEGTAEDWSEISSTKSVFREMNLYFNGELHEHSYSEKTVMRDATCRHNGVVKYVCECGDFNSEIIPALPHTPGEWETDDSGRTVKKCTECLRILEEKEDVAEETPDDEEITDPEETPEEGTQESETEENAGEESAEEESGIFEVIADVVGKIIDAIVSIFSKIAGLFAA